MNTNEDSLSCTPCYKVVQEHLATFVYEREVENRPLPPYVLNEFEAYLKCGILAHGFLRLKCCSCSQKKVVGFSCKKQGFCPSCAAKRMVESAAHLVDNVLPLAPYRQFVISFPVPLRFWFQTNKKLYARVHKIVIGEIQQYYNNKAKSLGVKDPLHGTISYTQRFGSALNSLATAASIKSKIAFGPNTGKYVAKIGSGFGFEEEIPLAKGKRCFSINGFSIHANSATNAHQRNRLETMIQDMARGPIANERIEITPTGNVKWRLKTQFSDGTTNLLLTPLEFLEKLSVLIPPPKSHLIKWSGCFAAHSPYRKP